MAHLHEELSGFAHHERSLAVLTLLQKLQHRPVDHRQPGESRRQNAAEILGLGWAQKSRAMAKVRALFL